METGRRQIDVHGIEQDLRGVWVRGEAPQELVLSDGSRLGLEPAEQGRVEWRHRDELASRAEPMTTSEAASLAGPGFAGYVAVRTRAEAQWLRAVAEWCDTEAGRLEAELAATPG